MDVGLLERGVGECAVSTARKIDVGSMLGEELNNFGIAVESGVGKRGGIAPRHWDVDVL